MTKANLIMLGAPGSGKGTRAVVLREILGIAQIATGDIFRDNIKKGTPLGFSAKSYIDNGELVPDKITASMVRDCLNSPSAKNGFILDGFPRTIKQAEMLEDILKDIGEKITAVVFLDVSDEEIVKRISGRLICEKCQAPYHTEYTPPKVAGVCDKCGGNLYVRDDDKPETVRKRLKVFNDTTYPLVGYYEKKKLLVKLTSEISDGGIKADMLGFAKKIGLL